MRLGIRLLFAFFRSTALPRSLCCACSGRDQAQRARGDGRHDGGHGQPAGRGGQRRPGQPGSWRATPAKAAFAQQVRRHATRPVDAGSGVFKQSLDFRVYVTDHQGRVVFDSKTRPWAPTFAVARRGAHAARRVRGPQFHPRGGGRRHQRRDACGRAHLRGRAIAGVLTVAKPTRTVQRFIDRAERKVFMGGLLLLACRPPWAWA